MSEEVLMVVLGRDPIMRGGRCAVVIDKEAGTAYVRLPRVGDPLLSPAPPEVHAFREQVADRIRAQAEQRGTPR